MTYILDNPNSKVFLQYFSGVQDLVATKIIELGEEITLSYLSALVEGSDQQKTRMDYLLEWYGFQCNCQTCCLKVSKTCPILQDVTFDVLVQFLEQCKNWLNFFYTGYIIEDG